MGLLDDTLGFLKTPEGLGVLSGLAGYAAGARRGQPINSLGRGGLAGLMGYNAAIDNERLAQQAAIANQKDELQIQQMRDQREAVAGLKDLLPENMRNVAGAFPELAARQLFKEPQKPELVTINTPQGPMQRWVIPGQSSGVDIGAPAPKEGADPWYVRRGPDGRTMIDPAYADLERTKASFARPPAQPMQPIAYVDGSGNTVWGTITDARGRPAANYSPTVQGAVAGAKKGAEAAVEQGVEAGKAVKRSDQFLSVANQAEELLKKNPTGGGFGAMVDAAGRFAGVTTESAKTAAELETVSGWLVSNVPRMEGPQSNLDIENYKTMAAKVGDRTVPVQERVAALSGVKKLQEKYRALNSGLINPENQASNSGGVRKYNPKTGRIE